MSSVWAAFWKNYSMYIVLDAIDRVKVQEKSKVARAEAIQFQAYRELMAAS